jgi:hypothetical protein
MGIEVLARALARTLFRPTLSGGCHSFNSKTEKKGIQKQTNADDARLANARSYNSCSHIKERAGIPEKRPR